MSGKTRDSDKDVYNFSGTSIEVSSTTHTYKPSITNGGWDFSTGKHKFTISGLTNGDKYNHTRTWHYIETKHYGCSNWESRGHIHTSTNTTTPNYLVNSVDFVGYIKSKTSVSAVEFAEGVSIRVKSETQADYGSAPDRMSAVTSNEIHVGRTATFEDPTLTITQNNRDIKLSWKVYNPKSDKDINNAPFAVEKWDGSKWVEVTDV